MNKILFCYGNSLNPITGGVQRFSDILSRYLLNNGYIVFYLISFDGEETYPYPVKVFKLPNLELYSQSNKLYYHHLLEELSIDIIINHDASNERSDFFLNTGIFSVKKISLYHQDPIFGINLISPNIFFKTIYKISTRLYNYLKKTKYRIHFHKLLNKSDKLVVLSDYFSKDLAIILGINSRKIESISNPIILEHFNNKSKKKQILFVSRLEFEQKRPDLMLKIWSKLETKFPDWELIFLGDGSARLELENLVNSMELENVRFEGFVDPVPYYKEASIIGMTSDYEGFGMVLIEAMQFGVVPISFFNWSSLQDIIVQDETGVRVTANDLNEYSNKLSKLLSNEEERNRISNNAKEYVKKFDIEVIGPQWLKLFDSILAPIDYEFI